MVIKSAAKKAPVKKKIILKSVKKVKTEAVKEITEDVVSPLASPPLFLAKKTHPAIRIFLALFFIMIVVVSFSLLNGNKVIPERIIVTTLPIITSLEITGKVTPKESATLSFEKTGKVDKIFVKEGDTIGNGEEMLTLSSTDLISEKRKAEAILAKAEANVRRITHGASNEEISLKEQVTENAATTLKVIIDSLLETTRSASVTLSKEIRGNLSSLFIYQSGDLYTLSFNSCDQVGQGALEKERASIQKSIKEEESLVATLSNLSTSDEIEKAFDATRLTLNNAKLFESKVQSFLTNDCNLKDSSLSSARSNVSTSFGTVSNLSADLEAKKAVLISQKNMLSQANKDLLVIKAGANIDEKDALLASVAEAKALVLSVASLEEKTKIVAPFDGTVSKVYVKKGENGLTGSPAISLLSTSDYQVEGYIRELDIASVTVGKNVTVTLDAFPKGNNFDGIVTSIDPSPTIQGGIPLYRILVTFVTKDERIRDGMSTKLSIILYKNEKSLSIPPRFLRITSDGKVYVKVVNGENVVEKEIYLGHRGDDGAVEVLSGLSSGDTLEIMDIVTKGVQKGTSAGGVPRRS